MLAEEHDESDMVSLLDDTDAAEVEEDSASRSSPFHIRYAVLRISFAKTEGKEAYKPRAAPNTPAFIAPLTNVPPQVLLLRLGRDSRVPTIFSFSTNTAMSFDHTLKKSAHVMTGLAQRRPTPPSQSPSPDPLCLRCLLELRRAWVSIVACHSMRTDRTWRRKIG